MTGSLLNAEHFVSFKVTDVLDTMCQSVWDINFHEPGLKTILQIMNVLDDLIEEITATHKCGLAQLCTGTIRNQMTALQQEFFIWG